jgi:hypothetical protein
MIQPGLYAKCIRRNDNEIIIGAKPKDIPNPFLFSDGQTGSAEDYYWKECLETDEGAVEILPPMEVEEVING